MVNSVLKKKHYKLFFKNDAWELAKQISLHLETWNNCSESNEYNLSSDKNKHIVPTGHFFRNYFFHVKIFLVVFCNICNRNPLGWVLTGLDIYKENLCIKKLVAKKVTWWEPWNSYKSVVYNLKKQYSKVKKKKLYIYKRLVSVYYFDKVQAN